jgi:hypothetical protein
VTTAMAPTKDAAIVDEPIEAVPPIADLKTDVAIALMKEYEQKLRHHLRDLRSVKARSQRSQANQALHARYHRKWEDILKDLQPLIPHAENLARYVSGVAQHGRIEQLTRLELRLRAAEFETAIALAKAEAQ